MQTYSIFDRMLRVHHQFNFCCLANTWELTTSEFFSFTSCFFFLFSNLLSGTTRRWRGINFHSWAEDNGYMEGNGKVIWIIQWKRTISKYVYMFHYIPFHFVILRRKSERKSFTKTIQYTAKKEIRLKETMYGHEANE